VATLYLTTRAPYKGWGEGERTSQVFKPRGAPEGRGNRPSQPRGHRLTTFVSAGTLTDLHPQGVLDGPIE
jgi:hypothetical protein